ncbi:MAG: type III pantothenate kinase [Halioglobus sp.]
MSGKNRCLQLDVGNSGAKWRLCADEKIVVRGIYRRDDAATLKQLLACTTELQSIWISSVASPEAEAELSKILTAQWRVEPWFARTEKRTATLTNSYDDATRMGVDRWLAMLGARQRDSGRLCVIDAGSALTIDIVSAQGLHEGGYIIPGPNLMERALLLDTDRVRFDEDIGYALSPGTSTAEAVRHGIALAQTGAVSLALDQVGKEPLSLQFCGGGGETLLKLLDRGGVWAPDLVFEGLEVMASAL